MASLNKIQIIGNLGRDPETRQVGETTVCNFVVAVTERFKGRDGQQQERTEWVQVQAWGRLGEIAQQFLTKGSPVYVEGKLQTRTWEKDGEKRHATEVRAENLQMLGGRKERTDAAQSYSQSEPDLPF
jgi:single-strand DNA-binding protein